MTTWNKPRVERMVQYVRENFLAGEEFADLADAQAHAETWCRDKAGPASTAPPAHAHWRCSPRPRHALLLAAPGVYDVPVFKAVKVHRDFHAEVAKALYSLPEQLDRAHARRPRRQ